MMYRVVALAGRRVDAPNASPRFPPSRVPLVRERLRELFAELGVSTLVSSAACGSDLIALEVAAELGMRRLVVLPFEASRFRETSVTDRPGEWGTAYDRVIADVLETDDLIELGMSDESSEAYATANAMIFQEALALGGSEVEADADSEDAHAGEGAVAVIVWEGRSRGRDDLTDAFAQTARAFGIEVLEVLTRD